MAQQAPSVVEPQPHHASSRLIEQDRGHTALTAIRHVQEHKPEKFNPKEYQSRAENLPAMIQNLGLASTLAFLLSKRVADKVLADHLGAWLLSGQARQNWRNTNPSQRPPAAKPGDVGVRLTDVLCAPTTSSLDYRRASHEARLYAGWLKRWSTVAFGKADQRVGDTDAE